MHWFRLYDDLINDPKAQGLPPPLFKTWINVLCLASKGKGIVPSTTDTAFGLRCTPAQAAASLKKLAEAGLLDRHSDGTLRPHNWDARQWKSDDSKERTRAYRARMKQSGDAPRDDGVTVTAPAQETDTEADTEQTTESPPTPAGSSPPKARVDHGTRLPADWLPSPENRKYAIEQGFFPSDLGKVVDKFKAHFAALPGRKGLSADWSASWTKFVLDEARFQKIKPRIRVEGEAEASVFVHYDTDAGRAWKAKSLKERGRAPPSTTRQGREGWYFPSEFPPDYPAPAPAPMETE